MASPFTVPLRKRDDELSVFTYTSQLSAVTSPALTEKLKEIRALMKSPTWGGVSTWSVKEDKAWNLKDRWEKVLEPLLALKRQEEEMSPADTFEVNKTLADVYTLKSDLANARSTLEENLRLLETYSPEIRSSCRKMAEVYKDLARVEILDCRRICSEKGPLKDAVACLERAWGYYQNGWDIPTSELARQRYEEGLEELKIHESLAINYVNFLLRCRESKEVEYREFFERYKGKLPDPGKLCIQALKDHRKSPGLLFAKIQIERAEGRLFEAEKSCRAYLDSDKVRPVDQVPVLRMVTDICSKIHHHVIAQLFCEKAVELDTRETSHIELTKKLLKMKLESALPRTGGYILSAALKTRDFAYARTLFEEIMNRYFYPDEGYEGLSLSDQTEVFLGRARMHVELEEFALARECLNEAHKLLQTESMKNPHQKWAIFHYCSACTAQDTDEAIRHFEEGWKAHSYPELVLGYLHFVFDKQLLAKALEISTRAKNGGILTDSEFYFWQAKISAGQEKPATVKENCDELLRFGGVEEKLKWMKTEVCNLAIAACTALDLPEKEIYEYRKQAYENDDSLRCIERFQELKEIQGKNSQDIPPPQEKDPQELLDAALVHLKKGRLHEATQMFAYLEMREKLLSPEQLYHLHHEYAETFMQMQPPALEQARSELQQALLIGDLNHEQRAEIYRGLAQMNLQEENFEKGYALCPKQVAPSYIEFLVEQQMYKRALSICKKGFSKKSDGHFWRAKVEVAAKNFHEALKQCDLSMREGDIRAALELKALILVGMERYKDAVLCISDTYHRFVRPENYRELSKKYLDVVGAQIIDEHLQKLLREVMETKAFQKAHYVEALLREYKEELRTHKARSINFFFLCGQLHARKGESLAPKDPEEKKEQEEQFERAVKNYEEALKIIESDLNRFRGVQHKAQQYLGAAKRRASFPELSLLL